MFRNILAKIRQVMSRMGLIKQIKDKTDLKGITESDEHYKRIEMWYQLYKGFYPEWHNLDYYTLEGKKTRQMSSMGMPKTISEEMAQLVFNEKCVINISDEGLSKNIMETFKRNSFYKLFQRYVEYMFALGGFAIKVYGDEKGVRFSYVTADCFIPLANTADEVTEGIFVNESKKGDKYYTLLEWHTWEGTTYVITNELYQSMNKSDLGVKVSLSLLYPDLEPETRIEGLSRPLFIYTKPNIANNYDTKSPLGISVYANALDTLKALDTAFDSFEREFRLGKKRIIVPATAVKSVVDPQTGNLVRYFDANDEVYQGLNFDQDSNEIKDISVALRVEEHISAINALLNILAMKTGFSSGTFTFDGESLKTATEVVSENSKTFRTKNSHETLIEEGIKELIITICEVAELYKFFSAPDDYEVTVDFDDSIAEDRDGNADYWLKLKNGGIISKQYALQRILDLTEEQAKEMIAQINEENATVTAQNVDFFGLNNSGGQ